MFVTPYIQKRIESAAIMNIMELQRCGRQASIACLWRRNSILQALTTCQQNGITCSRDLTVFLHVVPPAKYKEQYNPQMNDTDKISVMTDFVVSTHYVYIYIYIYMNLSASAKMRVFIADVYARCAVAWSRCCCCDWCVHIVGIAACMECYYTEY